MSDPSLPPRPTAPMSWRDRLETIARPERLSPGQVALAGASLLAIAAAAWFVLREPAGPPPEAMLPRARPVAEAVTTSTTAAAQVVVDVVGAVSRPGVYRLAVGARVVDLLGVAGGPGPRADLDRVNQAALLVDGSLVHVPRIGEAAPAPVTPAGGAGVSGAAVTPSGPIDLNTATLEQLDALPGVGPVTARAIVDARAKRGRFRSVDDLLDVRGIGPAKLDAMRDLVTV